MTGLGFLTPPVGVGPIVDPVHSAGVSGSSHRYIPNREGYADTVTFATLHDLVGSANLVVSAGTTDVKSHAESADPVNLYVARQNTGTTVSVLENGSIDLGTVWTACLIFKCPDVSSTICTLDGYTLSRAGNGSYTWGGNGTNNHTTAGAATNAWAVAIMTGGSSSFFSLNGTTVTSAGNAPAGSQTDRIYLGQRTATARTTARDFAELTVWPSALDSTARAAVLAAMRAKYSFVPQS